MDMSVLYRQVIMEHYKRPFNKGLVSDKDYLLIHMNNPSCGDQLDLQIKVENGKIIDIKHEGTGCSICCSSASVASQTLINQTFDDANKIINEFYELVKGLPFDEKILKGDVLAYQGVSQFPARIKCATLAWKALETGVKKYQEGNDK